MSITFEYNRTKKIDEFVNKIHGNRVRSIFDKYGKLGVELLSDATPKDTGKTSESWSYNVSKINDGYMVNWQNSNRSSEGKGGIPIVVLIRYGHTTRNGGYVAPNDFLTPVKKKLFDELANNLWSEVKKG